MNKASDVISALVLLRPAHGKPLRELPPPTSSNLEEYLPSASDAERALRSFHNAGFQVGPLIGISFSIAAPASKFESYFRTKLARTEHRGVMTAHTGSKGGYELPLDALPSEAAEVIEAITFEPPREYSPDRFER
jgi:hypothetical protein